MEVVKIFEPIPDIVYKQGNNILNITSYYDNTIEITTSENRVMKLKVRYDEDRKVIVADAMEILQDKNGVKILGENNIIDAVVENKDFISCFIKKDKNINKEIKKSLLETKSPVSLMKFDESDFFSKQAIHITGIVDVKCRLKKNEFENLEFNNIYGDRGIYIKEDRNDVVIATEENFEKTNKLIYEPFN